MHYPANFSMNPNQMSQEDILKTGTTCLALRFDSGVVIAADKRASAGYRVGIAEKIHMITKDTTGMAISGLVADAMSLVDLMRSELKLYEFENGYPPTTNVAANLLGVILHSGFRRYMPYWTQLAVAGFDKNSGKGEIFFIDPAGAVSTDNYGVIGSGSLFALTKLEDAWKEGLNKEEAKALAIRAIKLAASRDLYTGDGVNVFIITKEGVEKDSIDFPKILDS
ncbi:MAG: proteasome subunit beta [Candidatus Hodarchaeales archaeon]|jgi:proteasome beta subunit